MGDVLRWRLEIVFFIFCVGDLAFGLSFDSNGVKYSIPKKVVIKVGSETLFSSSKPKSWDEETDRAFHFRFEAHDFLIVGTWSSDEFTSYRLFHLGKTQADIKEYKFMTPSEDDGLGTFFTFDGKLHYWEPSNCRGKTAMVFEPGSLEFTVIQMKDIPQGSCLSADLQKAKGKSKINWKKLLGPSMKETNEII